MLYFFIAHIDPHTRQAECLCSDNASKDIPGLPPSRNLLPFLFPDAQPADWQPREYLAPTSHCFTLTGGDGGSRLHGFCRTCLPPLPPGHAGHCRRLPWALCVLSPHLWPAFFFKALELIDKLLQTEPESVRSLPTALPPTSAVASVLQQLAVAAGPRPHPGAIISLHWPSSLIVDLVPVRTAATGDLLRAGNGLLELEIPSNPSLAVPPARIFAHITPRQAVSILAALLLERRVVFTSVDPGRASLAVHAAAALLCPFEWHHIYLPLLPKGLADYLHAPVPLLAGATPATVAAGGPEALQGALLVDLDHCGACRPAVGSLEDDALLLPRCEALAAALGAAAAGLSGPDDPSRAPQIFQSLQNWYDDVILGGLEGFIEDASSSAVATADGAFIEHGLALDWPSFLEIQRLREDGEARVLFLESFRHSQMLEVAVRAALLRRAARTSGAPDEPFISPMARLDVEERCFVTEAPALIDFGAALPPRQQEPSRSPEAEAKALPPATFPGWTTFGDVQGVKPLSPQRPVVAPAAAATAAPAPLPPAAPQQAQGPLQQGLSLLKSPGSSVLPMSPLQQGAGGAVAARVSTGGGGSAEHRLNNKTAASQSNMGSGRAAHPSAAAAVVTPGAGLQDPFSGLVLEAVAGMVGPRREIRKSS